MLMLTVVVLNVILVLLWLFVKWRKVKQYWQEKGIPHHPPHPIFGSLTFLQRQNPTLWIRKIYGHFQSPYVGIWLFWRPGLVINSPEIARKILVKDADVFRNRFASSGKTDPVGSFNLFAVNDPSWTVIRRKISAVFTGAKLRCRNNITLVKSEDLNQRIMNGIAKENKFHVRNIFSDYSADVIGETAFSISCETTKTGTSVLRRITKEFTEFNLYRGLCWSSIFFFPELVDIFRFTLFPKKSIEELREIFRSIVQLKGGYEKRIVDAGDMVDALIKHKQDVSAENKEINEDFLLSQVAVMLLGGFDTTGATMAWIIYMLAWHPEYQKILYEEILTAKRQLGGKEFDPITLANLNYLTCVIKETLRINPPMGWLDRIAASDYYIDDKLTIEAGTVVYVNAVGMQMDPNYFPEPELFRPDRFFSENEITPYTFMPFGEGPRHCVGMRFAYQTLRQGIATVLLNYEVKTLPESPKPRDIKVEKNGMFYFPRDERMVVQFVLRKGSS